MTLFSQRSEAVVLYSWCTSRTPTPTAVQPTITCVHHLPARQPTPNQAVAETSVFIGDCKQKTNSYNRWDIFLIL